MADPEDPVKKAIERIRAAITDPPEPFWEPDEEALTSLDWLESAIRVWQREHFHLVNENARLKKRLKALCTEFLPSLSVNLRQASANLTEFLGTEGVVIAFNKIASRADDMTNLLKEGL